MKRAPLAVFGSKAVGLAVIISQAARLDTPQGAFRDVAIRSSGAAGRLYRERLPLRFPADSRRREMAVFEPVAASEFAASAALSSFCQNDPAAPRTRPGASGTAAALPRPAAGGSSAAAGATAPGVATVEG